VIARLTRDEGRMDLGAAVERLTRRPARFFGIAGRGELREGYAADVNVIDLERLAIGPLRTMPDLPGGAPRLYRDATGYVRVLVNGVVSVRDDRLTGDHAGTTIRAT
jgi:N-acyl-D-aspartate/D-glutamate deacylase